MAEKVAVISKSITYSGLFSVREIFKLIDGWLEQHGWDKIEASHKEIVAEKGKEINISLEPEKKENDYVKSILYIDITMTEVEDVVVKKGKKEISLNKGEVEISLDAKLVTDHEGKWVQSPLHMLAKAAYDKFIKKSEIDAFKEKLSKATTHLSEQIKAHLNLFQYQK